MTTKKLSELCADDLGKEVRYAFGGDSITKGTLQTVSHMQTRQGAVNTNISIDGVQHARNEPDATLEFVPESE